MDFGVAFIPTHDALSPQALAVLVEQRGQESLFLGDHTHVPVDPGAGLAHEYSNTYELFVALTAAALATSTLRVGSGICLVVERDPIVTAKAVASIDRLSGGRFEFGVGAGWIRAEMRNHGTDPRTRMALMAERMEAMRAIWTQDEASYHGTFVDFDPILSWPKPAQRPHPPILVGGDGPTVFERVLRFGDAWFPEYREDLPGRVAQLREQAGRHVDVMAIGVPADPAVLETLRAAGLRRVVHWLPSAHRALVEPELERWERAIAQLNGVQ